VTRWVCAECGAWVCNGAKPGTAPPGGFVAVRADLSPGHRRIALQEPRRPARARRFARDSMEVDAMIAPQRAEDA
jgi:hypothetical protein